MGFTRRCRLGWGVGWRGCNRSIRVGLNFGKVGGWRWYWRGWWNYSLSVCLCVWDFDNEGSLFFDDFFQVKTKTRILGFLFLFFPWKCFMFWGNLYSLADLMIWFLFQFWEMIKLLLHFHARFYGSQLVWCPIWSTLFKKKKKNLNSEFLKNMKYVVKKLKKKIWFYA